MDTESKLRRAEELRRELSQIEQSLSQSEGPADWPPSEHYFAYNVTTGAILGMFGAIASLLLNLVGALVVAPPAPLERHPFNLIRVYLTFPLGESALSVDAGVSLLIGTMLYIGTGMLLGIPIHLLQSRFFPRASLGKRFVIVSIFCILIWVINFYAILAWLQPLLFGGNWIVELIPVPVAVLTHLVFGWTMVLLYPIGVFESSRATKETVR